MSNSWQGKIDWISTWLGQIYRFFIYSIFLRLFHFLCLSLYLIGSNFWAVFSDFLNFWIASSFLNRNYLAFWPLTQSFPTDGTTKRLFSYKETFQKNVDIYACLFAVKAYVFEKINRLNDTRIWTDLTIKIGILSAQCLYGSLWILFYI